MAPLNLSLDLAERRALDDLADALGRTPEEIVRDAVRAHMRAQAAPVLAQAERIAREHADLLRRLGE